MKDKNLNTTSTKTTKTPQWIRDIATGADTKNDTLSSKNSTPLVSTNQYSSKKQLSNNKKYSHSNPDTNFNANKKIKDIHHKLLEIEMFRENDKQNEIEAEQKVVKEDKRIKELFDKRFNN